MSSSEYRDTLCVRLSRDGTTGVGEGAPIVHYQESALEGQKALEGLRGYLEQADPWARARLLDELGRRLPGQYAAKVDKAGGLLAALRMIETARAHDLKVMLGCMVSSSVAITAAAHLSPLVDHADLDGNLLVANDPFVGVQVKEGKLVLPDGPGLGVTPAA